MLDHTATIVLRRYCGRRVVANVKLRVAFLKSLRSRITDLAIMRRMIELLGETCERQNQRGCSCNGKQGLSHAVLSESNLRSVPEGTFVFPKDPLC